MPVAIPTSAGRRAVAYALLALVLTQARELGYARVRLDSHRASMAAAIALYRRLGFIEIAPYGPDPGGEFSFF